MIKISGLSKKYYSKNAEITALDNINVDFDSKGLVFILGKSGCGKTTFLNMLGGFDNADSGSIITEFYDNKDVVMMSEEELDRFHNIYMGCVFQNCYLIDNWNVRDNIAITLEQQDQPDKDKVSKVLEYVGLSNMELRKPSELSGGQAQRVAIARALVKSPAMILADEPTGNLDSANSDMIFSLLKNISKQCLVIVVSHDEQAAFEYGDRVIRLKDGRIEEDIVNADDKYQYRIDIEDSIETKSIQSSSVEKIREFLLSKLFADKKDKDVRIKLTFEETRECENDKEEEKKDIKVKSISKKTILRLALNNLRLRKVRLAITIFIFALTMMFLQLSTELMVAKSTKSISEYLIGNDVSCIVPLSKISYTNDFGDEYDVNSGNTKDINALIDKYWKKEDIYKNANDVNIESEETDITVVVNTNAKNVDLLCGTFPKKSNEICITDFAAMQLKLGNETIGNTIHIFGLEFIISGIIDTDYEEKNILSIMKNNIKSAYDEYIIRTKYLKCICSEDISTYLNDNIEVLTIDSSNFVNEGSETYINSKVDYSAVRYIPEEKMLIAGRLPQNENEVIVSYNYALRTHLIDSDKQLVNTDFTYQDIYAARYNGAFENKINMYDYIESVKVVGVVEDDDRYIIDVWLNDSIYDTIKTSYCKNQVFDSYELDILGFSENELTKCLIEMQEKNIQIDEPNIETIYGIYENKDRLYGVILLLTLIFVILTILLNVSFISYSVSDNHSKIGILRALGVNKKIIISIYAYESVVISVSAYVISCVFSSLAFNIINNILKSHLDSQIVFFYRNIPIMLIVLLASLVLGIICIAMPVASMSKEKAINLIKN